MPLNQEWIAERRTYAPACLPRGASLAFAAMAALLLSTWAGNVFSYSAGITGRTLKSGAGLGCGSCHSPSQTLGVAINGPTSLAAGAQGTFTVDISSGANTAKMGVDIAASSGTLSETSSYLQVSGSEVTHNSTDLNTDTGGAGSFTFKFTVPAGAAVGSTYTLYAAARNSGEWNNASNFVVTVPKLNQTITFGAQTSPRTYSNGGTFSISPVATATSGLSITYTSDTPSVCTTPGTTSTTVTMQGAGTCTIRANQNGNSNYNAAPDVTRSITINKGNQSITFGSQVVTPSFSTGGTFNLSPAASASSGLAIQYSSITAGVCTKAASGISVNMIAVGTCTIVAAQPGDTDWNAATSVQRSITISKGNQTITFPAQSNKAFTAGGTFSVSGVSASSGLAVTYTSLTPTICTTPGTTSTTVTMVDNGTCTIEASQAGNSNFNPATDVTGDILLTETPLAPLLGTLYSGDARATITFGANGNGPNTTYTATCTAAGQTTRTGSSSTVYSPIVVTSLANGVAYSCSITASNAFGTGPASSSGAVTPATTPLAIPVFRSSAAPPAALYTFNVGTAKTFTVVTTARPNATLGIASALPSGMTYQTTATNSKIAAGLALLGGTPAAGTVGAYSITFTASNTGCGGTLEPACPTQVFTLNIAKGSPTITFPAVPDQPYSPVASYNLAATIATPNSTLATTNIVFTSTTPAVCTVSGTLLTTVSTGTCTINANSTTAAGYTASYNAALQVSRSFAITKANQTITFGAQSSRTYSPGGTFALSPIASASSGLAVSYASLTPAKCTIIGTTVTIVSAGTCTIEASQDGNTLYLPATDVTQNIAINMAAQTITFPVQGSQPFVPGGSFAISPLATSTSGLTVDYASTSPGVCMAAGTNVIIVSVGICTISATQPGDQNYTAATPVNRNISINAVPPGAPVLNETFGSDATIRLFFDPPANNGGAGIISYRGTCNPGNVKVNSADSPVVVGGLTNNTLYSCTVAAENAAGTGNESNLLTETPVLRSGTVLWTAVCSACHGATPNAGRLNAAGSTGAVIDYVRSVQPEMLADGAVQALTANELSEIAKYIRDQLTPITANTTYVTPVDIDVGLPKHLYLGGVAFEVAQVVTQPANGTLSVFNGTVITYTPNVGFAGMDSFTYRGRRSTPALVGDAFTVTINVATPAAPVITSPVTANGVFGQAFSYQITATNSPVSFGASPLGAGISVNVVTGQVSGIPGAAGVFNATVSATNPGGTGMQVVQVTISPANQVIAFGAQSSPRPFGSSFAINPIATASSGLAVSYSSLTTDVCTVAGTTVTPVSAGVCTIAANQAGNGNYNAALQVTQSVTIGAILPGAPTGLMAVAGDAQVSLSFAAPANNGGSSITQYNASCAPSGTGSSSASPIVVTGLLNNTQYTCTVTATNAAGQGPASGSVMVTPQNTPVAPSFTSANATAFTVLSAGSFNVTASGVPLPTMSLFSGTLPTGVTFNASPSTGTGSLSGTPASGTAAGSPYTLTFRATNASGTPNQSFTLTVAKANQTITFANPGTRGFSVAPFAIAPAPSSSSGLGVVLTSNTPSVCTVSGNNVTTLATGVCSISADQPGNVDYNAAPQVTQGFGVSAGTQTITFGGQTSPRNFSTTPFALSPVAFSTSGLAIAYSTTTPAVCVMSGNNVATLSAGLCTIAANQPGNANYAAATQVTQSVTVNAILPGAPTIGTASGADQQAMINFTAPSSNGGAVLTYTATCTTSGQPNRTGSGASSPVTVSAMVNGLAYSCSVAAANSAGTGPSSGTVMVTPTSADGSALWTSVCSVCHAATPAGNQLNGAGSTATVLTHVRSLQPVMLANSNVQALNQAELASIAAFIGNNVVPIQLTTAQGAPVQVDVSGHITFTNVPWSAFTAVEVVTPPANGMVSAFTGRTATYTPNLGFSGIDTFTYRGKRTAPDVLGDAVQVTITVSPGAPVITSAGTANGTFGAVFSYQIAATGTPTAFGASGLPAGLSVDNVTGLVSGTAGAGGTFNATVTASNAGGTGMALLNITIAPAAQTITFNAQSPSSQSFVPGGSFAINPLASGGASGNTVTYSSTTPSVCTVSGTAVTMVFGGTCTIAANQAGNANYAAAAQVTRSVTINPVAPGMPAIGNATPGNQQAQIAFAAPSSNGGSPITQYTATCNLGNVTGTGAASPITVSGLTNGTQYTCSVTATNAAALTGPASGTVQVTPAAITVPGAPIIGIATEGDGSASLAFSPPLDNGGATISGYTATCSAAGQTTRTGNGIASPIVVSSLTNGVTYDCSITAANSAGTGPASSLVQVTPEPAIAFTGNVVSRKVHTGLGAFPLPINSAVPITGLITVEPRVVGVGHVLVFEFTVPVSVPGTATVVDPLGAPVGGATTAANGNTVEVTLSGIADNRRVTVSLTGVNGSATAAASVGFLVGDVTGSGRVTGADISAIKSRITQLITTGSNFVFDIDLNGAISTADVNAAKARAGLALP